MRNDTMIQPEIHFPSTYQGSQMDSWYPLISEKIFMYEPNQLCEKLRCMDDVLDDQRYQRINQHRDPTGMLFYGYTKSERMYVEETSLIFLYLFYQ
jgi:hypothetical protein